jgi:hypothetical protein
MDHRDDTEPLGLRTSPGRHAAVDAPYGGGAPVRPTAAFHGYPDHIRPDPVRRKVVDRLALVGHRHARHVTDLRDTPHQPGPHAVVIFYRQPGDGADQVLLASRMFLDGADVADLPTVLRTLRQRAAEYRAAGGFDPRRHLSDRAEPMTAAATYLGVGTSSLVPAAPGAVDMPWQGLASLQDGTRLTLRGRSSSARPQSISSSHTLDTGTFTLDAPYPWRWADRERHDPEVVEALEALDRFHALLADTSAGTGRR